MTDDDDFALLPTPHPSLGDRFSNEIYRDPAHEFAPFGSDEAADAIYGYLEFPESLTPTTTLRQLANTEFDGPEAFDEEEPDDEFTDAIVVGLGIMMILVTGRIDDEGRARLLAALERRESLWGDDTDAFRIMLKDVRSL